MKVFKIGEYHGQPKQARLVGGVSFAVTTRAKGTTVPLHCHDCATFIVLLSGQHHWVSDSGRIAWSVPGVWYFRPPMHQHTHEACATDISSLGLHFPLTKAPALNEHTGSLALDHPIGKTIIDEMQSNLKEKDAASDYALTALFNSLVANYLRHARPVMDQNVRKWLTTARHWLDQNYMSPVTLGTCATAVSTHPSHLAREFRAAYGQTVGDYIRDRRLEWSYDQLSKSERKVSDIAVAAGFADHAHFSRMFKQRYGLRPSDLRR